MAPGLQNQAMQVCPHLTAASSTAGRRPVGGCEGSASWAGGCTCGLRLPVAVLGEEVPYEDQASRPSTHQEVPLA